jgi:putative ABC transport system substrate-binding protein
VGGNVTIEPREGDRERLPALAADLVRQHVAVISVVGVTSAQVARAVTQTIPVVFGMAGDPVEVGVVASGRSQGSDVDSVRSRASRAALR